MQALRSLGLAVMFMTIACTACRAQPTNPPTYTMSDSTKTIYLAGGCFWGTEHFFKQVKGVTSTEVGYANGNTEHPSYEEVCRNRTGHAETVRVDYDPSVIALDEILALFLLTIDPTTLNRQGGDVGTQYRTGIYYTDSADRSVIDRILDAEAQRHARPIVVEREPLKVFYPAEAYHQDYLDSNPSGYCHIDLMLFERARSYKPRGVRD